MTPEEKKIEEAAKVYCKLKGDADIYSFLARQYDKDKCEKAHACICFAKSDAAKEYHTRGLLSKEDILSFFDEYIPGLLVDCLKQDFENWIENKNK